MLKDGLVYMSTKKKKVRPDMTYAVDWALKANYLSIFAFDSYTYESDDDDSR